MYIDGQEGTTGLKILERFKDRNDIEIMKIDEDKRKDNEERKKFICLSLIHISAIVLEGFMEYYIYLLQIFGGGNPKIHEVIKAYGNARLAYRGV